MKKNLDEMTPEELGRLFPIYISEPNPQWGKKFCAEKKLIKNIIGKEAILRIEHIGSTAVPGLPAKDTIDILLEIKKTEIEDLIQRMENAGYHYIPKPENPQPHIMLVKGYTPEGYKGQCYHIHVRYPVIFSGDWDEIYFRDYLKAHPETAAEYAVLKNKLAADYRNDRDGYTEMKSGFIKSINELAKRQLPHKNPEYIEQNKIKVTIQL